MSVEKMRVKYKRGEAMLGERKERANERVREHGEKHEGKVRWEDGRGKLRVRR